MKPELEELARELDELGKTPARRELDVPPDFGGTDWRLVRPIGKGTMGTVYEAEQISLARKVAIKVMQNFMAGDPKAFDTFKNEAQSAAKLNHPHVAQVYSFGREKDIPYLEMELVPGGDLSKFIADGTVLDPAFVIRVGMEIAEGLKAAEEGGLFHGDVKPENIFVSGGNFEGSLDVRLGDFGMSTLVQDAAGDFAAPEVLCGEAPSAEHDVYSLGMVLYSLGNGSRLPFLPKDKQNPNVSMDVL
jgi:serine/threonine protein kinase